MDDSTADLVRISCRLCGKPEHGSSSCDTAPGWDIPYELTVYPQVHNPEPPTIDEIAETMERLKAMMQPNDTALVLLPSGHGEFSVHKVSAAAMRTVLACGGTAIEPGQGR